MTRDMTIVGASEGTRRPRSHSSHSLPPAATPAWPLPTTRSACPSAPAGTAAAPCHHVQAAGGQARARGVGDARPGGRRARPAKSAAPPATPPSRSRTCRLSRPRAPGGAARSGDAGGGGARREAARDEPAGAAGGAALRLEGPAHGPAEAGHDHGGRWRRFSTPATLTRPAPASAPAALARRDAAGGRGRPSAQSPRPAAGAESPRSVLVGAC